MTSRGLLAEQVGDANAEVAGQPSKRALARRRVVALPVGDRRWVKPQGLRELLAGLALGGAKLRDLVANHPANLEQSSNNVNTGLRLLFQAGGTTVQKP